MGGGLHNPFEIEILKGLGVKFKNLLWGGGVWIFSATTQSVNYPHIDQFLCHLLISYKLLHFNNGSPYKLIYIVTLELMICICMNDKT